MKLTTPTILAAMMAATMTSCADRAEQGAPGSIKNYKIYLK